MSEETPEHFLEGDTLKKIRWPIVELVVSTTAGTVVMEGNVET